MGSAGWEGSTADARVLFDAVNQTNRLKVSNDAHFYLSFM